MDDENDFDDMQQGSGSASPIHTHNNEMSTAQSPRRGLDELGGSGSHMDNKECVCAVCQRVLGKAMKRIIFILVYRCMYVCRYAEFCIVCTYVCMYVCMYLRENYVIIRVPFSPSNVLNNALKMHVCMYV